MDTIKNFSEVPMGVAKETLSFGMHPHCDIPTIN
jgi:hypothetical protein